MPDLTLNVNGKAYSGWTRVHVHRGMEEIAGKFEIEATEQWPSDGSQQGNATPLPIQSGDQCSLAIDGTTIITGYVDAVEPTYDDKTHTTKITGRDATGDLIDCSAIHAGGEWTNATLTQIANDLAKPFGIKVTVQTDVGDPFPKWKIQQGETVYECLERAARLRGVLLLSDGQGAMIIARPSNASIGVTLQLGVNILRAQGKNDWQKRFSQYIVKGQRAGSDNANGAAVVAQKGTATDTGVTRYRPLVIVCEDQGQIGDFNTRAKLEATVRAARALTSKVWVQGWTYATGKLWSPNTLIHLTDRFQSLDRDLLIKEVDLTLDENGTRAELSLTIADAFDVIPPKKLKKQKGGKGKKADAADELFGNTQ